MCGFAVQACLDGVAEPLVDGFFLEAAGFGDGQHAFDESAARFALSAE